MLICSSAISQPNFVIDTILFSGKFIQKVSASRSSDIWIIEDTNSRNIYRIDKNLFIYNHSLAFQTITNSPFTAILNNDTNNTLLGTANDYVFHWYNNNINKLNSINGLTDSTINAIVGYPSILFQQNQLIVVTANTSNSFNTNNCLTFTTSSFNSQKKSLELGRYSDSWGNGIIEYGLAKIRIGGIGGSDMITCGTNWSSWMWGSGLNWQNVNTGTVFCEPFTINNPRVLFGTDNNLIASYNNSFNTYLSGFRINKTIKYRYDSPYALVASDSGFYLFCNSPSHAYKASFPGNNFKANDVDVSPDGCVWMATDNGLIRFKDLNCNDYKINFTVSDSVLMLNEGCEINFKPQCTSCAKNWSWNFGDGASSNTSNPSHTFTQSGTYVITLVSGNGTCTDTVSKNITMLVCCDSSNYNFVNLGSNTSTICTSKVFDAGNCINCDYHWSTGDTTQTLNITASGNYWVSITNYNGCVTSDTINVFVNQLPSVSFSGLSSNYCENSSSINILGSPIGGTYSGGGISGNVFNPSLTSIGLDTISYTYTDANGCSNSSYLTVTVNPVPTVNFSGLTANYCINSNPVNLTGTPAGGIFSGIGISGNIFDPSIAGTGNSDVLYTYTDGNSCTNVDTQQVIINSLPIVNYSGLSINYCITSATSNLTGVPSGGVFIGNGLSGNLFNPSSASIGTNNITYNYTDINGCSNSTSQTTNIVPLPIANISGVSSICQGETINLAVSGIGSFLWNTGDTTISLTESPAITTTYFVTASNFCGNSVDSILINVNPLPIATVSNDTTVLLGNSANISTTGGISYVWNPVSGLSCTSCQNPIASPQNTTTYSVIVTGTNGCSITKMVTIYVNDDFEIFVPDIFSPNGDGHNDILYVRGTGIKELNFVIYDRLGEKIFESNDLTKGWDGTFKGSPLNSSVFLYYLSATLYNDKKIKTKGDITLIR